MSLLGAVLLAASLVTIHVDTSTAHRLNVIRPLRAIGTGVDSDPKGKIPLLYSPSRTRLMLSTGLGWLTYRLYTELSIEDWHWNPSGSFSDPAHAQGYWMSAARPNAATITDSFGYRLPHRGSTRDQGDDNDYSRIDDGDSKTYWKSNPYLTRAFTHAADSTHPQWVLVDFGAPENIEAVRISWGNPFATHYRIEYWFGDGDAVTDQANGSWHLFNGGSVTAGKGGDESVRVTAPVNPRFIRIVMDTSSGTCDSHGAADNRNCMGYAMNELSAGTVDAQGALHDRIVHSRCGGSPASKECSPHQTVVYVSSVDPWHSELDRVRGDQDQPGVDIVAQNPIARRVPVMFPVPLFYSTPENAAAELRYLEARRYRLLGIEMGEEVDGQYALPEDYAELYLQWADALHRVDPKIMLGGPAFSGVNKDIPVWADASGDTSWMHRFIRYLKERGRLGDLAFMSFEHYPFRNCDAGTALQNDLLDEPSFVRNIVSVWHDDGVPAGVPLYITESNFSADGTGAPQRIAGALWFGDYAGAALSAGLAGVMYYQIEAEPLGRSRECGTWGAYNPYLVDEKFNVHGVGAAYYAAQLLTGDWLRSGDAAHELFPVSSSLGAVRPVITAYAVKRPDSTWSVLIDNKDVRPRDVAIQFDGSGSTRQFSGNVDVATFGEAQYAWSGANASAKPNPDRGIVRSKRSGGKHFTVAARSLTVIRGRLGADPPDPVSIDIDASKPIRTLRPQLVLGSTVDKEPAGTIPQLYSPKNVRAMLDAGWGWLSYRLFTELSVQDWHWNPQGTFSARDAGYWTSSASIKSPYVLDSFGYRLPHRGSTTDQGNNEDYSRLDDGNTQTYWKSNPYLTSRFTGDSDTLHPQWVVVDLEKPSPVNAVRITWSNPFARDYAVEYWSGPDPFGDAGNGGWRAFSSGRRSIVTPDNGVQLIAATPVRARFVRIVMARSSNTCDSHGGADARNCLGFAIAEIGVGLRDASGTFRDYVRHVPCGGLNPGMQPCGMRQTATYVSSTDPWHDATSRVRNQEQPGLDLVVRSGLTRGLPAMYPVPMIYSTPENAVAEIRYLKARKYAIDRVELGEEPDGQYMLPEDYGALYIQWAHAIHRIDPGLKLGGPVFSGVNADLPAWRDARGNSSWLNRFLAYLHSHGAMNELAFMSFEHYPYLGCEHGAKLLQDVVNEPALMASMPVIWRRDGLPANVPMYVTEANFTWVNHSQTQMQIEGALWQADYMASAISNGVDAVVYYQYEPVPLSQNDQCKSDWGNLTMFVADKNAAIHARAAQYWAGRMLTHEWFAPENAQHTLYRARAVMSKPQYLSAYALKRPGRTWSLMIVNKDHHAHDVTLRFLGGWSVRGPVTRVTLGSDQYVWRSRGASSAPSPNRGPATSTVRGPVYRVPPQSITVLRFRENL